MRGLGLTKTPLSGLSAVEYYRTYLPLREVSRNDDIDIILFDKATLLGAPDEVLLGKTFYHMSRMYCEGMENYFDLLRKSGAFISFDVDDDLTEPYMWLGENCEIFKQSLGHVNFISVSTKYLAKKLSKYNKRDPVVIPNYIDFQWFSQVAENAERLIPDKCTVGLSGTKWHLFDWWGVYCILKDLGDSIAPLHLGHLPGWIEEYVPNLTKILQAPYQVYPEALSQFDIVLIPLEPNEFNKSRSDVKALEVMSVGSVAVCSNAPIYQELANAGAPIVMVEDQHLWKRENLDLHNIWYETVKALVDDEARRKDLSEKGKLWVQAHRDMRRTGWKKWAKYFHDSHRLWLALHS